MQRINLIYPECRRFTSNMSTHRIPGLAITHAGLPILGEILRLKGYDVKIFDESIAPVSLDTLADADLVGISINALMANQGYRLADEMRERGVPVAIGGVHASLLPEEAVHHADYLIRNEGEKTFPALLEALGENSPLGGIPGLSYHVNGKVKNNRKRPYMANLDANPFPNWDLIEGYYDPLVSPLSSMIYFTQASRGCPAACNFCSITRAFGQKYRHRSAENVVDEILANRRPGQDILFFHDDNFVGDKDYAKELLEEMIRRDAVPAAGWHSQMRADVAEDPELLDLIKRTNCIAATFGFESVNPRTLEYMKKGQTVEDIKKCIEAMHALDVFVIGFFVLGSDEDDTGTIHETLDFAKTSGVDFAGFMPLTPFPGTPLYKELDDQGRIFCKNWDLYDVEHVVFYPERMTPYELYSETLKCYRKFYTPALNTRRIRKLLRRPDRTTAHEFFFMTWPLFKRYYYQKELLANRDYIRAIKRLPKNGDRVPEDDEKLNETLDFPATRKTLALHDHLTQRNIRKFWKLGVDTLRGRG
ncbi:B12-binding domain-containing radical SAM protein [bacterium]